MDFFSLTVAALAGISANIIFDLIKKYLSLKKHKRITVKLPDGVAYEFNASRGNKLEIEKLIRSFMYATEKEPLVHTSNVQLMDGVIRPSLEALKNKFDDSEIHVELQGFDDLPTVLVDPDAIQQVVFNLLMNAVQHSPRKSTIKVYASVTEDAIEIRFINPNVADIPAEETERIFEMYEMGFRGAQASLREPSGMGTGLYVAKNLLKAHGGDVAIRPDKGLFETKIKLPLKQEQKTA